MAIGDGRPFLPRSDQSSGNPKPFNQKHHLAVLGKDSSIVSRNWATSRLPSTRSFQRSCSI
jgi:hypothetical protein